MVAVSRFAPSSERTGSLHNIDSPLRFEVTMVSPDLASELLAKLHPNQRGPKQAKIAGMVADMKADRWHLTHQGVAIDVEGRVVDGQNKLIAVTRSGCTVPMVICYGIPLEALVVMDCGTARNAADAGRIAGVGVTNSALYAVARHMILTPYTQKRNLSIQESIDLVITYRSGLDYVFDVLAKPMKHVIGASIRAVVARASYSADKDVIGKFAEFLYNGLPDNTKTQNSVVLLRNWLLTGAGVRGGLRDSHRKNIYGYTEFALRSFLDGQRIIRLEFPEQELFAIPRLRKAKVHPETTNSN
jgi:hypothetical protein